MNTWNKRNFRHIKNDIFDNIVVVLIVGIMLLICGVLVFAGIKNERNRISTGTVIFKDYTPASRTNDSYRAERFSLTISPDLWKAKPTPTTRPASTSARAQVCAR